MFDLKTILGRNSIDNRLSESIGQTNRVLLHITVDYTPSALARSIQLVEGNKLPRVHLLSLRLLWLPFW